MKKMYVAMAAAVMLAGTAVAQVKIGIEGGINLNNLADQYEGETTSNQIKTGVHAGVVADLGIGNHFCVSPALRYIMKGGQEERNYNAIHDGFSAAVEEKNKLSYHYIEFPLNLVYKTGMPGSGRFMIGAGPYVAYMVNAQNKYKKTYSMIVNGDTEEDVVQGGTSLNIGNDTDDQIKGFDYGAQAFVGYSLPMGAFVKAGSSIGLANTKRGLKSDLNNELMQKNYNFFLTLGYMFGGK